MGRKHHISGMHRERRGRNLALLAFLLGLVVLFFFVTLEKAGSNWS